MYIIYISSIDDIESIVFVILNDKQVYNEIVMES